MESNLLFPLFMISVLFDLSMKSLPTPKGMKMFFCVHL